MAKEERCREEVIVRLSVELEELKAVKRWLEGSEAGRVYAQVGNLIVEVDRSKALELVELRINSLLKALRRLGAR